MYQNKPIDIYAAEDAEPIGTVCDLQPYSGELAQKEYGLDINCVMRLYTAPNSSITEGALVANSGQTPLYVVKYTEQWDDYTMALLTQLPRPAQGEIGGEEYGGGYY